MKRRAAHLHTKMSSLDSVVDVNDLVNTLKDWGGHDAAAVTDHGVVQSIPDSTAAKKKGIKPIFGMEGYMIRTRNRYQ